MSEDKKYESIDDWTDSEIIEEAKQIQSDHSEWFTRTLGVFTRENPLGDDADKQETQEYCVDANRFIVAAFYDTKTPVSDRLTKPLKPISDEDLDAYRSSAN